MTTPSGRPLALATAVLLATMPYACSFTLDFNNVEGKGGGPPDPGGASSQGSFGQGGEGGSGGQAGRTEGGSAGRGGSTPIDPPEGGSGGDAGSAGSGGTGGEGGAPHPYVAAVLASGPEGYYRFDDWREGHPDLVRSTLTGAPLGSVQEKSALTYVEGVLAGDASTAAYFDGQIAAFGTTFALKAGEPRTFEFWIKPDPNSAGDAPVVFSKYAQPLLVPASGYFFSIDDQGTSFTFAPTASGAASAAAPYAPAEGFTYVAVVSDGATHLTVFVNDDPPSIQPANLKAPDASSVFLLGALAIDAPASERFRGALDEFAVYPRVLDDKEIRAHYLAGVGGAK